MKLETLLRRGRRLRCLGVDDGPFQRGSRREVLVVGAVYSSVDFEGLLSTRVRQDGANATARLIRMISGSKFQAQLHLVMLDGITLGGFNVVNLPQLARAVALPCAAVMRAPPDMGRVRRALANLPGADRRLRLMELAGPIHRAGELYFQCAGLEPAVMGAAILSNVAHGAVPECLRAAHLIAAGIVTGQSGRRA